MIKKMSLTWQADKDGKTLNKTVTVSGDLLAELGFSKAFYQAAEYLFTDVEKMVKEE